MEDYILPLDTFGKAKPSNSCLCCHFPDQFALSIMDLSLYIVLQVKTDAMAFSMNFLQSLTPSWDPISFKASNITFFPVGLAKFNQGKMFWVESFFLTITKIFSQGAKWGEYGGRLTISKPLIPANLKTLFVKWIAALSNVIITRREANGIAFKTNLFNKNINFLKSFELVVLLMHHPIHLPLLHNAKMMLVLPV